jgi:cysteine-rich repeat protein
MAHRDGAPRRVGWLGVLSAHADIDASGQWFLQSSSFPVAPTVETWTQVGTTLTTDNGWTGTIDPASGDFSMTVPAGPCGNSSRAGTVAADALSLMGVETVVTGPMCHPFSYLITGSRYECGNGTVDPAEQCDDDNNANGDGCDPFCKFENCSTCDDGNPCTIDTCDGAMTCGAQLADVRSCRSAGKSKLVVKTSATGSSDKLTWT